MSVSRDLAAWDSDVNLWVVPPRPGAHNSAVECHLHTVEVVGSNPAAPTIESTSYKSLSSARSAKLILADELTGKGVKARAQQRDFGIAPTWPPSHPSYAN